MDMLAPRERIPMAFKAKERVDAEALENPEMFVRNSLGDFAGKGAAGGRRQRCFTATQRDGSKAKRDFSLRRPTVSQE
jgi:hypothetical protein